MKTYIKKIHSMMAHFTVFDIGMLKLCLISAGILIGVYFASTLTNYLWLFWGLLLISWLYIIYKVFGVYWQK